MATFSIKGLLVAVGFVAVSVVALLNANRHWHSGLMNLAVLLLAVSLIGTYCSAQSQRASCVGFFILGFTYFMLATQWWKFEKTWDLMPQRGLRYAHQHLFEPRQEVVGPVDFSTPGADVVSQGQQRPDGTRPVMVIRPSRESFVGVGTAIFSILFGILGGVIGRVIDRRRQSSA